MRASFETLSVPLSWMLASVDRSQTSLPVGGYPNLGHSAGARWEFDTSIGVSEYARMASSWVDAGALIVGGCCGVTAKHLAGVRTALNEAALAR